MGWGNNNPRNPNAPCPDPNKHCGDDIVSASIENPYLIAACVVVVIIWGYFIICKPKIILFKFKNRKV